MRTYNYKICFFLNDIVLSSTSIAHVQCFRTANKEILLPGHNKTRGIGENVTFHQYMKGWLKCILKEMCRSLSRAVEVALTKSWKEKDMVHILILYIHAQNLRCMVKVNFEKMC